MIIRKIVESNDGKLGKIEYISIALAIATLAVLVIVVFSVRTLTIEFEQNKNELDELKTTVSELQTRNQQLENDLILITLEKPKKPDNAVESDLNVTESDLEAISKIFAFYEVNNKNVKIYISCVMINRAYQSNLSITQTINDYCLQYGINLDDVTYTQSDVRLTESVFRMSKDEIYNLSSNALYFFEAKDVDLIDTKPFLLLFTTNGFNFYTDLSVG